MSQNPALFEDEADTTSDGLGPTGRPWPDLPEPRAPRPGPKNATVIAMTNQKGGVAKTTSVASIGAALAEQGKRVLLVDLDPQASLTFSLGIDPDVVELSTHEVVIGQADIADAIVEAKEIGHAIQARVKPILDRKSVV